MNRPKTIAEWSALLSVDIALACQGGDHTLEVELRAVQLFLKMTDAFCRDAERFLAEKMEAK